MADFWGRIVGTRFGPTECEDFDEALSWVSQVGSLRDYQKDFGKLRITIIAGRLDAEVIGGGLGAVLNLRLQEASGCLNPNHRKKP